ncbi:MAG: fructose-specific PTS transporter subunit EIIC [Bacilli bacterium]|nr:fructose-specific PTS transporter subunit EIIC [Bacilli bacterium]
MRITDLLSEKTVSIKVKASSKEDVIKQAVALISHSGVIGDEKVYEAGVFKREEESTTGIGEGIAIPHCKSDVVKGPALAAMVIPEGVDYQSLDGEPVHLLFLIAAPNSEDNVHLEVLARLSEMLMDENFKNKLLAVKSAKEFLKVIDEAEGERLEAQDEAVDGLPRVVAVTACPTGIAHTYMAEESLKNKAKEMGISIKVETNGSGGAKNILTAEEIEHAEGVVIAADVNIETDRFAGKRVVFSQVAKGIHEPERLINEALDPATPVFKAGQQRKADDANKGKESIGHQIYKHLMSGVSHMLPFVIGGGILIALAFLIDTIAGNAGSDSFGSVNVVAGWFKNVGGFAFSFMVWILAGFIAYSIAGRPGLAVGMVGGFIATTSTFNIKYSIDGVDLGANAGFIGGIVAGFAAGYIVVGLSKLFSRMPKSLDSLKPMLIYPILGIALEGLVMYLINTPLIYVNIGMTNMLKWMGDNPALLIVLCALLGLMMATDMGGPINKAAYVFGTAMLATQQTQGYIIMAAVMAGGMVPPLGIALSATLFPRKYSKKERGDAMVNYVMGASFITEGAIPFAAADPWRVIVSCMGGSAVAGLLTGLFRCQLLAPHGGVFVLATIQPAWAIPLYLLAVVVGSFVTAILLGLLKKNNPDPELGKWKGISFKRTK